MSFEAHIIHPEAGHLSRPEMLGLYAMPIAANIQNTGDRLQSMVNKLGFPFVASDLLLQSKRTIFDMGAQDANQPTGDVYRSMSLRRNDFFADQAEPFAPEVTVGMGDSLGVPVIQGMQLHSTEGYEVFDAILLRDGWNLGHTNKTIGIARYLGYQVRDAIHQQVHKPNFDIPGDKWSKTEPTEAEETNFFEKIRNVADLMRSAENITNATILARETALRGIAMNVVCLRQGLSGTEEQQRVFVGMLDAVHRDAIGEMKFGDNFGRLRAEIVDGWHSDLLDPTRGAQDVENTLSLIRRPSE